MTIVYDRRYAAVKGQRATEAEDKLQQEFSASYGEEIGAALLRQLIGDAEVRAPQRNKPRSRRIG